MKQKYVFALIIFLLSVSSIFAQDPPQLKDNFKMTSDFVDPYDLASKNWVPKTNGNVTNHSFDVLHYKLLLDWYANYSSPYNHDYKAVETVKFVVDSTLNAIQLNAGDSSIVVDSVRLAGTSFMHYDGILNINLDAVYNPGDSVSVMICFTHKNYVDLTFHANSGFVFTDCSPEKARNWFPCWDRPFDKATFEVVVNTKNGVELCSNGALVSSTVSGDTLVSHWKSRDPMSTYIMANLSNLNFNYIEDYWHKPSNPQDSIPVLYYYNNGDVVDSLRIHMTDMMNYFSSIYGEYPFEKLGWATLNEDFPWSGMENQTIISLYPNGWNDKNTTSHEFAHHWFGDLITHATWADIFVKEGFPSYSASLWANHLYGRPGYLQSILEFNSYYLQYNPGWPIYNPSWASTTPAPNVLFNYAITYSKSACVLHSLRGVIGDTAFFKTLKSYATDTNLMYKTATVNDFVNKVNSNTGADYTWFFDQWLNNANHPIYNNNSLISNIGADWYVDYTISQTQTDAPFFKMPVEVEVLFTDNSDTLMRVMNDVNDQTFTFAFNKEPKTVVFDPMVKILPKMETAPPKCSGMKILTAISDTIEDGSGVANYGNSSLCFWKITPLNNPAAIQLHFLDFDTEQDSDTLIVSDVSVTPIQELAVFSGRNIPTDLVCNTGKIRLKFSTNKYVTHQGWSVSYTDATQINDMGNISAVSLFPNPASDVLSLFLKLESDDDVEIKIINLLGQPVYLETEKKSNSINKSIDISTFNSGVYIVEIRTRKGSVQRKFVKG